MHSQNHYDWGLRAIKTCLTASGRALRATPTRDQTALVVDTLRKQIKSKLIEDDEQRFEALVQDVFGAGFEEDSEQGGDEVEMLRAAVVECMSEMDLVADDGKNCRHKAQCE